MSLLQRGASEPSLLRINELLLLTISWSLLRFLGAIGRIGLRKNECRWDPKLAIINQSLERRWRCPQQGRGYHDFENAAKPDVEIGEVLISWLTSGFNARLLRISVQNRRTIFVRIFPSFFAARRLRS